MIIKHIITGKNILIGDNMFPSECRIFSINVKKLHTDAKIPTRNNETDAGLDLYALEDYVVPSLIKSGVMWLLRRKWSTWIWRLIRSMNPYLDVPMESQSATKVKTGIALEIPVGMYGQIKDRSGMGSKLIKTLGGVIDSGYRGDVTVCLANLSFHDYTIKAGDKIAQIVIQKYESLYPVEVAELSDSERGEKGFNSSGT